jgi:PIN domain nuclease of toxin-antitoxin system
MTCLLDTHALLWAMKEPEVFPRRAREILESPSSRILISMVTPWEMAIKAGLGKLDAADILDDFESLMKRNHYEVAETKIADVVRSGLLPAHHRDPFDRLLAAQALDLRIPILSRDPIFELYGVQRIWE